LKKICQIPAWIGQLLLSNLINQVGRV